ncbi:hypothetical protein [Nesterenkonia cremea]|uniref:Cell division protein FtsL n=1 Tax=Nesterenkonia cremea TaxID=1882340 RepID=A0A917EP23_9MICC|nr:hypothetical protein [Nesterenkonia cremea]GGE61670.1 hypothetical protein GCM10011401_05750 [Nesterenkonia cremea]
MSAEARADDALRAVRGNTARKLDSAPLEHQESLRSAKPVLRALPKVKERQRGLLAGIIGLLAAALGIVLAVNIHVSSTQYQVVELQNHYTSLSQQNQALAQQVQHRQSPQSLSDNAVSLGMVMPASAGSFDLASGAVAGEAPAADSSDRPSSFVSAPVQPGDEAAAPVDVADEVAGAPSGMLGSGALDTLEGPVGGHNGEEASGGTEQSAEDLNGGTIPAPGLN